MTTSASTPQPMERDEFFRELLRVLADKLEDVVGIQEAEGYISLVGSSMGEQVNAAAKASLGVDKMTIEQVADTIVDFKTRLGANFRIEGIEDDKMTLISNTCPFGDKIVGHPSLCMVNSTVVGVVVSDSTGYAKVEVKESIAKGACACRVVVHLTRESGEGATGLEFFGDD